MGFLSLGLLELLMSLFKSQTSAPVLLCPGSVIGDFLAEIVFFDPVSGEFLTLLTDLRSFCIHTLTPFVVETSHDLVRVWFDSRYHDITETHFTGSLSLPQCVPFGVVEKLGGVAHDFAVMSQWEVSLDEPLHLDLLEPGGQQEIILMCKVLLIRPARWLSPLHLVLITLLGVINVVFLLYFASDLGEMLFDDMIWFRWKTAIP